MGEFPDAVDSIYPRLAEIVCNALKFFDGQRYDLLAWSVMPNHVHCLVTLAAGQVLHRLVQSWKSFTAHQLGAPRVWQRDYFDRLIRDTDHFVNVRHYIRNNPVKAGLAEGSYLLHEA
jgi:REP element-mobilizing transposase RayT